MVAVVTCAWIIMPQDNSPAAKDQIILFQNTGATLLRNVCAFARTEFPIQLRILRGFGVIDPIK